MPKTFRQYLRSILVPLGLADERAYRLALKDVFNDDTFLVSFPKSGNTWLRFLIAYALIGDRMLSMRTIDEIVPDIYSARESADQIQRPRFLKAHDPLFDYYPKCVYVVRDYRDVLVSYYHYHIALGSFKGDLATYIDAMNTLHPFGTWKDHVSKALLFAQKHPDRMLIVRYEDLVNQTEDSLVRILQFCKITPKLSIKEIISKSSFSELRAIEDKEGSEFKDISDKNFFREGIVGSWNNTISAKLSETILERHRDVFSQLGYS